MKHHHTSQGQPYPLGATIKDEGVNFSIFSEHAEKITLVLLHEKTDEIIELISFDPSQNTSGIFLLKILSFQLIMLIELRGIALFIILNIYY